MNREKGPCNGQEPNKERETKDDGRYIIFYTFTDHEAEENESSDEEGPAS